MLRAERLTDLKYGRGYSYIVFKKFSAVVQLKLVPFAVSTNTAMRRFPKRMTYAVVSI